MKKININELLNAIRRYKININDFNSEGCTNLPSPEQNVSSSSSSNHSIESLPSEILNEVFLHLNQEDRSQAILVNHSWKKQTIDNAKQKLLALTSLAKFLSNQLDKKTYANQIKALLSFVNQHESLQPPHSLIQVEKSLNKALEEMLHLIASINEEDLKELKVAEFKINPASEITFKQLSEAAILYKKFLNKYNTRGYYEDDLRRLFHKLSDSFGVENAKGFLINLALKNDHDPLSVRICDILKANTPDFRPAIVVVMKIHDLIERVHFLKQVMLAEAEYGNFNKAFQLALQIVHVEGNNDPNTSSFFKTVSETFVSSILRSEKGGIEALKTFIVNIFNEPELDKKATLIVEMMRIIPRNTEIEFFEKIANLFMSNGLKEFAISVAYTLPVTSKIDALVAKLKKGNGGGGCTIS